MKKTITIIIAIIVTISLITPIMAFGDDNTDTNTTDSNKDKVSVMFTNGIHSHLESKDDKGGLAKIKTAIDKVEEDYQDTFVFDAGNFSMGTAFQSIFTKEASELRTLGDVGYDVTSLGQYEYDYGTRGLAKMLKVAANYKTTTKNTVTTTDSNTYATNTTTEFKSSMPEVVCANIDWEKTLANKKDSAGAKKLKSAFNKYGVQDYTIVEKGDTKIAVFGIMGDEEAENLSDSGVVFDSAEDRAKEVTEEINRNGEADMIVCLSSGTTDTKKSEGEDVDLAKSDPDIDMIISGGNEKEITDPIKEGDTYIVSAKAFTNNIGHIVLKKSSGKYKIESYDLINLDKKVNDDSDIQSTVDEFKSDVNNKYLGKYGYTYGEFLANNTIAFTNIEDFGMGKGEDTLGDLISDSFVKAVKKAEGKKYDRVDVAFVSAGSVMASLDKGKITASDAFDVCSLGEGEDGTAGYPLVSMYLTGKDLKTLAEMNTSLASKIDGGQMYMSGLSYSYNNSRTYLNKAFEIQLDRNMKNYEKIKNDTLYRVVTGRSECDLLDKLSDKSKNLLVVKPKDKNGKVVKDYDSLIIKDSGSEMKEWSAVADYIDSFKGNKASLSYSKTQGRINNKTGINPINFFKQPNNYGLIAGAILLIIIVLIIGTILLIRNKKHRKRGYYKSMFKDSGRKRKKPIFKERKMKMRRSHKRKY